MSYLAFLLCFFALFQCKQYKSTCEYQSICNCEFFLGELVHYLTEVQGCQYFCPRLYVCLCVCVCVCLVCMNPYLVSVCLCVCVCVNPYLVSVCGCVCVCVCVCV